MSDELQAEIERLRKANFQLREGAEEQQQRMNYLRKGIFEQNQEIEQTCGKVLGYSWFKDDQNNFPGSTEKDGVCVGDHVAETIVSELASRYTEALARIKRLEEALEECDWAFTKFCPEHESRYGDAWEKVRDALNRPNPFKPYWQEAKP